MLLKHGSEVVTLLLGAHESISGGLHMAFERAKEDTCEVLQIFSKSSHQWQAKPLTEKDLEAWQKAWKESGIKVVVIHDSYLINLGSPKEGAWRRSVEAFRVEVERAGVLGVKHLVFHPGAHGGTGEKEGIKRIIRALNEVHSATEDCNVMSTIETTAGQGSYVGYRFEHIAEIMDGVEDKNRVGACFDTCHVFAAGYELRTRERYEETMDRWDEIIGLEHLHVFHLNDSKHPLGSRKDRHEHIGKGYLGLEPFRFLLNDPRFKNHPGILETPPLPDGRNGYRENLEVLRSLISNRDGN